MEPPFGQAIKEHLELKERNSGLEREMPLARYWAEDLLGGCPVGGGISRRSTSDSSGSRREVSHLLRIDVGGVTAQGGREFG